jgi:predicted phosphoadenosine phosphosulfate sulfurtransferase
VTDPQARKPTGLGMRVYENRSVRDAAYDRIEWIFREFPSVMVNVSGGKDSTVLLKIALDVAAELKRLPVKVYWLDQEAEWQSTVDIVREWMHRDDVDPVWLQVPFRIFNASSQIDHWLLAWDPAASERWVHPQDPLSYKLNRYGTDRFHKLFNAALERHLGRGKAAGISGVRCEESPTRRLGLTSNAAYKWVTWGRSSNPKLHHYAFYPLYDWFGTDVWKFIHDEGLTYSRHYDQLYQHGSPMRLMRVSNLHHETAVRSLFQLQEIEPDTYERLVARIGGIDMAGKLGLDDYFPDELPFMFKSWLEYREHLLDTLVDDDYRPALRRLFAQVDRGLPPGFRQTARFTQVRSILTCDWEGAKLESWYNSPQVWKERKAWQERKRSALGTT